MRGERRVESWEGATSALSSRHHVRAVKRLNAILQRVAVGLNTRRRRRREGIAKGTTGHRPRLVVLGIARGLHLRGPKVRIGRSHPGRLDADGLATCASTLRSLQCFDAVAFGVES